jgi:hypothetical protein
MGKHHFTIKSEAKTHKCYLDEDGRVYIYDDAGNTRAVSAPTAITKVEDAKEAAAGMIEDLVKKK